MAKSEIEVEFVNGKPSIIIWNDGRRFGIKKILYECEDNNAYKRYTVLVGKNEERYLYVTSEGSFVDTV